MDLMAIFGPQNSDLGRKAHLLGGKKTLEGVAATMQSTWMDMVMQHAERWPRYEVPNRDTFLVAPHPSVESDPRAARRKAWEGFPFERWA